MKKIFAIVLVLILALSLLTACGGDDKGNSGNNSTNFPSSQGGNNNTSNGNGGNTGDKTMSVTPAAGWEEDSGNSDKIIGYSNDDGSSFMVKWEYLPAGVTTAGDMAAYTKGLITATTGDTTSTTVSGMDAAEFTHTASGMKFRTILFCDGDKAYTIQCCAFESKYDATNGDFQTMLDSFTLK